MEGSAKPIRPRSGRLLIITVAGILTIVMLAAAGVLMLDPPDDQRGRPGGSEGGDDSGDQGAQPGAGEGQEPSAVDLKEGDLIDYAIASSDGGPVGTMRVTFRNITPLAYDVEMVQTIDGHAFAFAWTADANDTLGGRPDGDVGTEEPRTLVGEETIDTAFGPRRTDHYRRTSADGNVTDCYIGHDIPILYRSVTTGGAGDLVTVEMSGTSIEAVRTANA